MPVEDKELRLRVMREFARRSIDTRFMDVYCNRGIVRLGGRVSIIRGSNVDLREYFPKVIEIIRRMPEVRDVVSDVSLR